VSVFTFGIVLLCVSLGSLSVYLITLYRLVHQPHHAGLVRTACCRVAAAFLYVCIAMSTLAGHKSSLIITLLVFITIQLLWQANSIADVMLTRRENKHHRK
jgi:hypothetical protein